MKALVRSFVSVLSAVITVCLCIGVFAESAASASVSVSAAGGENKGITVKDAHGRTVRLSAPAKRIVALAPGDCEILFAIGAGNSLVAAGDSCDRPEAVRSLPSVSSGSEINIEQILSLSPDLVVIFEEPRSDEHAQMLASAGVPAVITLANNIPSTFDMIRLLGRATGKDAEAEALISDMQKTFDRITAASGNTGKTIFFEVSPLAEGLRTAGRNTFMDDIAKICGLTNIFSDVDGWAAVSQEQVIERNPDYILAVPYSNNGPEYVKEIISRPGWNLTNAVRLGNIGYAETNEITRPGPRLREAAIHVFQLTGPDSAKGLE